MKYHIKAVIEISEFLFYLSPSHQVTIGLKGYISPKTIYNLKKMYLDHNPQFSHTSLFNLILSNDVFAAASLIRLC